MMGLFEYRPRRIVLLVAVVVFVAHIRDAACSPKIKQNFIRVQGRNKSNTIPAVAVTCHYCQISSTSPPASQLPSMNVFGNSLLTRNCLPVGNVSGCAVREITSQTSSSRSTTMTKGCYAKQDDCLRLILRKPWNESGCFTYTSREESAVMLALKQCKYGLPWMPFLPRERPQPGGVRTSICACFTSLCNTRGPSCDKTRSKRQPTAPPPPPPPPPTPPPPKTCKVCVPSGAADNCPSPTANPPANSCIKKIVTDLVKSDVYVVDRCVAAVETCIFNHFKNKKGCSEYRSHQFPDDPHHYDTIAKCLLPAITVKGPSRHISKVEYKTEICICDPAVNGNECKSKSNPAATCNNKEPPKVTSCVSCSNSAPGSVSCSELTLYAKVSGSSSLPKLPAQCMSRMTRDEADNALLKVEKGCFSLEEKCRLDVLGRRKTDHCYQKYTLADIGEPNVKAEIDKCKDGNDFKTIDNVQKPGLTIQVCVCGTENDCNSKKLPGFEDCANPVLTTKCYVYAQDCGTGLHPKPEVVECPPEKDGENWKVNEGCLTVDYLDPSGGLANGYHRCLNKAYKCAKWLADSRAEAKTCVQFTHDKWGKIYKKLQSCVESTTRPPAVYVSEGGQTYELCTCRGNLCNEKLGKTCPWKCKVMPTQDCLTTRPEPPTTNETCPWYSNNSPPKGCMTTALLEKDNVDSPTPILWTVLKTSKSCFTLEQECVVLVLDTKGDSKGCHEFTEAEFNDASVQAEIVKCRAGQAWVVPNPKPTPGGNTHRWCFCSDKDLCNDATAEVCSMPKCNVLDKPCSGPPRKSTETPKCPPHRIQGCYTLAVRDGQKKNKLVKTELGCYVKKHRCIRQVLSYTIDPTSGCFEYTEEELTYAKKEIEDCTNGKTWKPPNTPIPKGGKTYSFCKCTSAEACNKEPAFCERTCKNFALVCPTPPVVVPEKDEACKPTIVEGQDTYPCYTQYNLYNAHRLVGGKQSCHFLREECIRRMLAKTVNTSNCYSYTMDEFKYVTEQHKTALDDCKTKLLSNRDYMPPAVTNPKPDRSNTLLTCYCHDDLCNNASVACPPPPPDCKAFDHVDHEAARHDPLETSFEICPPLAPPKKLTCPKPDYINLSPGENKYVDKVQRVLISNDDLIRGPCASYFRTTLPEVDRVSDIFGTDLLLANVSCLSPFAFFEMPKASEVENYTQMMPLKQRQTVDNKIEIFEEDAECLETVLEQLIDGTQKQDCSVSPSCFHCALSAKNVKDKKNQFARAVGTPKPFAWGNETCTLQNEAYIHGRVLMYIAHHTSEIVKTAKNSPPWGRLDRFFGNLVNLDATTLMKDVADSECVQGDAVKMAALGDCIFNQRLAIDPSKTASVKIKRYTCRNTFFGSNDWHEYTADQEVTFVGLGCDPTHFLVCAQRYDFQQLMISTCKCHPLYAVPNPKFDASSPCLTGDQTCEPPCLPTAGVPCKFDRNPGDEMSMLLRDHKCAENMTCEPIEGKNNFDLFAFPFAGFMMSPIARDYMVSKATAVCTCKKYAVVDSSGNNVSYHKIQTHFNQCLEPARVKSAAITISKCSVLILTVMILISSRFFFFH